jgi:hypothetical protein
MKSGWTRPASNLELVEITMADTAVEVFFSYSHKDEALKNKLADQLTILQRLGVITSWNDRMIDPGSNWRTAIDRHLNDAKIILLFISADFLASDFCYGIEMKRAIERHECGEARVIPVILRACLWTGAPFGKLQALPVDGKPITSWANMDEAFKEVAEGVEKAVKGLNTRNP